MTDRPTPLPSLPKSIRSTSSRISTPHVISLLTPGSSYRSSNLSRASHRIGWLWTVEEGFSFGFVGESSLSRISSEVIVVVGKAKDPYNSLMPMPPLFEPLP